MNKILGLAVAVVFCTFCTSTFAQCNRSGGGQSSMNSPGSFGSLSSQPNSSLYSYSGSQNYTPTAGQLQAYQNQAMYQAMVSQQMDRLRQAQMVNQVAAQRMALRNAQKARKEGKAEAMYTAAGR